MCECPSQFYCMVPMAYGLKANSLPYASYSWKGCCIVASVLSIEIIWHCLVKSNCV